MSNATNESQIERVRTVANDLFPTRRAFEAFASSRNPLVVLANSKLITFVDSRSSDEKFADEVIKSLQEAREQLKADPNTSWVL
jgi:hypothetical protein